MTQHVVFPEPHRVARAQAAALAGIPAQARGRIGAMTSEANLTADDLAYLTLLFGADVLARYRIADDAAAALRLLLGRFDLLLEGKLARLEDLRQRARAGYVLTAADAGQELDWAWGPGTGQAIDPARPAFRGPAATALAPDPRDALPAVRVRVGDQVWRPRRDLLGCGPTDRCFVGETDDDQVLTLRFGDGRYGLAPPLSATPPGTTLELSLPHRQRHGGQRRRRDDQRRVVLRYKTEPDQRGTEPARRHGRYRSRTGGHRAAAGSARVRGGPAARDHRGRLRRDRRPARRRPAGRRAAAVDGVVVRGAGGDRRARHRGRAGLAAHDERRLLHRYRRIGHDVRVVTGVTVPVALTVCVQVQPDYIAGYVRAAVLQVLGNGVLPDGTLAMFHPDNLTFGTSIRVSAIVAAVAAVAGVRGAAVTVLKRQFAPDESAVAAGVLTLRGGRDTAARQRSGPPGPRPAHADDRRRAMTDGTDCGCGCGCGGTCCTGVRPVTPRTLYNRPGLAAIDYRAGRYGDFFESMIARLASLPELAGDTTREPDDPGIALLDGWALVGDIVTFYAERQANEGYLSTATQSDSLALLGRLVSYQPRPAMGASGYLAFTMDPGAVGVIPAGSQARSVAGPNQLPQTFETAETIAARADWNQLAVRLTRPAALAPGNADCYDPAHLRRRLPRPAGRHPPGVRLRIGGRPERASGHHRRAGLHGRTDRRPARAPQAGGRRRGPAAAPHAGRHRDRRRAGRAGSQGRRVHARRIQHSDPRIPRGGVRLGRAPWFASSPRNWPSPPTGCWPPPSRSGWRAT